jgi:hypothetical protein
MGSAQQAVGGAQEKTVPLRTAHCPLPVALVACIG